jgi:Flp pilus assembly protein TadB
VAVIAVFVGVPAIRRWVSDRQKPDWLTQGPVHGFVAAHRRGLQWATLALGLIVLVLWDKPTTLVAVIVVLITLVVIALVGAFAGRRSDSAAPALPSGDAPPG